MILVINNMDHMRISGNEPSSWSLAKKVAQNWESDAQKVRKHAQAESDGVKTHKITISVNFNTENFDALKTLWINRSRKSKVKVESDFRQFEFAYIESH